VAGVEVRRGGLDCENCNALGKERIQRLGRALWRRAAFGFDAGDLPEGVDACIGAAGNGQLLV
jgi:hypothetical protein